jgi:hypothetical protein
MFRRMCSLAGAVLLCAATFASLSAPAMESSNAYAAAADPAIPGDPSVPASAGTLLPFGDDFISDVVVDQAGGHVFVSGGQGASELAVTNLDGALLQTIPDLPGAEGMALSVDGSTLYVAVAGAHAVAAVDTGSLEVQRFTTGTACPRQVAVVGQDVYFTESCDRENFHLMRLVPASGAVDPVTTAQGVSSLTDSWKLVSHPFQPGRLYVVDNASVGRWWLYAYDLEPDGLTARLAATQAFNGEVADVDFFAGGQKLFVASSSGVDVLSSSDLNWINGWGTFRTSLGGAAEDGYSATLNSRNNPGESRVWIDDPTEPASLYIRSYMFAEPTFFPYGGAELTDDHLYVVAQHPDAGPATRLYTFTDFATPAPVLRVKVNPAALHEPVRVDGSAYLLEKPFPDHELTLWRSGADGLVSLGSVVTGPDGTFSVETPAPPTKGGYVYTLVSPSEPGLGGEIITEGHSVPGLPTTLRLEAPDVHPGDPIVVSGFLGTTADSTPISGATVELTRRYNSGTAPLPSVTTGPDGTFSFEVPNQGVGPYDIVGTYAGDATTYAAQTARLTVSVKHPVSIELAPATPFLVRTDRPVLRGRLLVDDGQSFAGKRVTWERYNPGATAPSADGFLDTAEDGAFHFTDTGAFRGLVRWRAFYLGDATHDAASTEVVVPYYYDRRVLQISADRWFYAPGSTANLAVGGVTSHGVVKLYAQPYGQESTLVAELPPTANPVPVPLTRNTTITAVYEPNPDDYYYPPGSEVRTTLLVRPSLQQGLRGTYATRRRTHLVHRRVDPRLTLKVTPTLPGRCVRVRVDRLRDGAYRLDRRTGCIPLDSQSRASWTLVTNAPVGARYRLRYLAPPDAAYADAAAAWTYLELTR